MQPKAKEGGFWLVEERQSVVVQLVNAKHCDLYLVNLDWRLTKCIRAPRYGVRASERCLQVVAGPLEAFELSTMTPSSML